MSRQPFIGQLHLVAKDSLCGITVLRDDAATLIGINLGPNLSVTGSLATVLWLTALRRDGIEVSFWEFFKVGCVVMPVALLLCLYAVCLS